MMKQNYYCLVAGCPDVTLDMAKPPISENQWREDMSVALSPADKRLVELIYLERDNRRFLDLLTGHDTEITAEDSLHGVFTDEELQEANRALPPVQTIKNTEIPDIEDITNETNEPEMKQVEIIVGSTKSTVDFKD